MDPKRQSFPAVPGEVVEQLVDSYNSGGQFQHLTGYDLPSFAEVVRLIGDIREVLFPGFVGDRMGGPDEAHAHVAARLEEVRARLRLQLFHGLHHRAMQHGRACLESEHQADAAAVAFVTQIPELRRVLLTDIQAALDGDPAATGPDEIIFSYPGFLTVTIYRIAHFLQQLAMPVIPRMMTEHAHQVTGIDIHPGATIDESFFIDHGTGVVIGETTNIGKRVRLYQGVTLGALSLSKANTVALRGHKRHPTIEDDVIIYAGATILGGETVIGQGAVIGGNCWITRSVAPGAKISFLDTNSK
ncbi:MAG TPA: serine acetyltransferase [Polyangia bacterium]|jgi:serine O-acetyltransferase